MTKTVFSKTADVAREWARGELNHCRTGSNTSMRDGVLMSYGTPIAKMLGVAPGERIALISTHQWSSGTSKVQGEARSAAKAEGVPQFDVPHLSNHIDDIEANLADYEARISHSLEMVQRGRVASAQRYRNQAAETIAEAAIYATHSRVKWQWVGEQPVDVRHPKEG